MNLRGRLSGVQTYPYKERIPLAAGWLAVAAWTSRESLLFVRVEDYVSIGGVALALLCKPKGRLFWFFEGTATGALLVGGLNLLHSKAGAPFVAGLIAIAAMAFLMREHREKGPPA